MQFDSYRERTYIHYVNVKRIKERKTRMETDVRRESWACVHLTRFSFSSYMDVINVLLAVFYLTSAAVGFPSI